METTKKHNQFKKIAEVKASLGKYKSMDQLSAAKIARAQPHITNLDMSIFEKKGYVD